MKRVSRALVLSVVLAILASQAGTAKADLVLYASDAGTGQLFTLDPTDGAATLVGGYGHNGIMGGLAYDPVNDLLFGSDVSTNSLYRLNQSNGEATLIGPFGIPGLSLVQALAFDSSTARLYGAYGSFDSPSLYQIDMATGAATQIGVLGEPMSGLSFDPVTHGLYGSSVSNPGVFTINPATGQIISRVSSFGFNGISFDPTTAILYGVANGGRDLAKGLYTINTQNGSISFVGALSLNNPLDIQFAIEPVPESGSLALIGVGVLTVGGWLAWRKRLKLGLN